MKAITELKFFLIENFQLLAGVRGTVLLAMSDSFSAEETVWVLQLSIYCKCKIYGISFD